MSYNPTAITLPSANGVNSDTVISGSNWSGNVYTGLGELNDYNYVSVALQVDEPGTLTFQFSLDGTNWSSYPTTQFTVASGINEIHGAYKGLRYMRPVFTGTNGSRTYFRLKTMYSHEPIFLSAPLNQSINSDADAIMVRSILTGQDFAGNYRNSNMDSEGHLKVNIDEPLTAFGELSMAQPTPVCQVDFVYGINTPQMVLTGITSGGTVTSVDGLMSVTTSATTNSSAICFSTRYLKYRDGQGALGRMTGVFTSGVTGSNQYVGLGTSTLQNGLFFAYSGNTFGIWHRSSGSTVSFTPQASWSEDVMNGSSGTTNPSGQLLDPTKGNVYQIKYQYLGFGMLSFFVENSENGDMVNVHNIKYANRNVLPSLRNASLNLIWAVENTTNNTAITVRGASGGLFNEGITKFLGPKNALDNQKNAITTLTNILTIRNATNFNGMINRAQVRITTLSVAYDGGNGIGVLQVHKNATLGGAPSYTTVNGTTADAGVTITNGQSVVSYDTAGTTVTPTSSSFITFNTSLARNTNILIDVSELDIFLNPGEIMTFACKASVSGSFSVSANWNEDI